MTVPPTSAPARAPASLAAGYPGSPVGATQPWLGLALAAAGLAAAGNVVGLLAAHRIYGNETDVLADSSLAQDAVSLCLVVPLLLVLGLRAARGSTRAYVCWLGCLAFTAYSYAIYAFALHFGPLFLLWTAVLGLSFYALIGSLVRADATGVHGRLAGRGQGAMAWTLIAAATLFGAVWLREIVPDLLTGRASTSASTMLLPTNPVHVLDLALFLPAVLTSGVMLLRGKAFGHLTAPGLLVFLALTCVPVLVTPVVAVVRGYEPNWGVVGPLGLVLVLALAVLTRGLRGHATGEDTTREETPCSTV